jgi:hypothetical protein
MAYLERDLFDIVGYQRQMEAFTQSAYRKGIEATKRVAKLLQKYVVEATRVDTGRARASWYLVVDENGQDPEIPSEGVKWSPQEARAKALAQGVQAMKIFKEATQSVSLVNWTPYISLLEYGGPNREADGMLQDAITRIQSEIPHIGRRVAAGDTEE